MVPPDTRSGDVWLPHRAGQRGAQAEASAVCPSQRDVVVCTQCPSSRVEAPSANARTHWTRKPERASPSCHCAAGTLPSHGRPRLRCESFYTVMLPLLRPPAGPMKSPFSPTAPADVVPVHGPAPSLTVSTRKKQPDMPRFPHRGGTGTRRLLKQGAAPSTTSPPGTGE